MGRGLSTIAGVVVGVIIGVLIGLGIAAPLQIDSGRWWALAGSALGAALAVAGSIIAIHYEAGQKEKSERRRLADEIDGALKHIRDFQKAAGGDAPDDKRMREAMKRVHAETLHICEAMKALKHKSAEIDRAAKLLTFGHATELNMLADSNRTEVWDALTKKHVEALEKSLNKTKAELRA